MPSSSSVMIRTPSGLSGDMLLTGLSQLADLDTIELNSVVDQIELPALRDVVNVKPHLVNAISGFKAEIDLPHEHHHRTFSDIKTIIDASRLADSAKTLSLEAFTILAKAEAKIHGIEFDKVAFHEVGALDSILDICASAEILCRLSPENVYCSPLPVCDGTIHCEHGLLASPAPAVQEMLIDVPVYGIDSNGETITPTAIAFLRAARAEFGKWPAVSIRNVVRAYGGRVLPGVPVIGPIGFASGIATRASEFKKGCPQGLSLACGGWKKLPSMLKPLLREGLAAAGVFPRLVNGDFVYLSKNAVTMLGGVAPAISAGRSVEHGPVAIQVKNVEEALFAAENGAGIIMVDTGRLEDLSQVHAALCAHQYREKLTLAFGGGVKLGDLAAVREAGAQAVDVGRAILDAPLLDLRLTITEG